MCVGGGLCMCMHWDISFKNEGERKMILDKWELEKHGDNKHVFQEIKCSSSLNDYATIQKK